MPTEIIHCCPGRGSHTRLLLFLVSSMMCMGASRGAEKSEYWAFRPLSPAKVPPVEGNSWARNAIDHFILARAQEKAVEPNPPTDRRTLIRRAYFDLIGLAPTRQEVTNFVENKSDEA